MPYRLIFVGCCLLGLSELIRHLPTFSGWDMNLLDWMHTNRMPLLDSLATWLSYLGGMPFVLLFSLFWAIQLVCDKKYNTALFLGLAILSSSVIGWLLKWWIARPRPPEMYHLVNNYGDSFPSVHSVYAATLATCAVLIFHRHRYRRYIMLIAMIWLVLMGISRIYAGVHYPTDVLAGWSIGFIWISLLWLWFSPGSLSKNELILDKNLKR